MSTLALWDIYRTSSLPQRTLAALRPWICPLEPILRNIPPDARVLDIGCGNGLFLTSLCRFQGLKQGIGIDVNPLATAAAKTASQDWGYPLDFHCSEKIEDWPTIQTDVVSMIDVMHHIPSNLRVSFLQAALQRVGQDGCFLYKDMCSRPWWRVGWNMLHDLVLARQLVQVEPIQNVIRWAQSVGFEVVARTDYSALGLYGHELVVMRRPNKHAVVFAQK